MTRQDATKKLAKLYGKKLSWRDTGRPTSPEQREEATARYREATDRKTAAYEALQARKGELLAADAAYQQLKAAHAEADKAQARCRDTGGYRITVGENLGFAFMVRIEGDNWADVVRKAEAEKLGKA